MFSPINWLFSGLNNELLPTCTCGEKFVHLYAKEAAYKFNNIPSFETVMLCFI
ncbi:hypothetical protein [Spiroplasma ixodetis]|uniref:hypothetical protein n=1 Tax=Spiroplasma ixodetis TaxID=2141 RepID=UPI0024916BFB|nr:hypothetical protein [Spiroplasma ixodetis]